MAMGELSGDGHLDLAVANGASNTVSVLLGHGDGTFAAKVDYETGNHPVSVAIGDLNGDSKPDLVVANNVSATISVLLGTVGGTLAGGPSYGTETYPSSVGIADLNGDGKSDLAVANWSSNSITVLLGDGAGGFATPAEFPAGTHPSSVAIQDLNGDGKPDAVVTNSGLPGDPAGSVSVLLGNGDGTFQEKNDFPTGREPSSVAIGDLNGDSKPDLAIANRGSNTVSLLSGNGDGTFANKIDFGTGNYPQSIAIGDLNGDGRPDLTVANSLANTVSVLLHRADDSSVAVPLARSPVGPLLSIAPNPVAHELGLRLAIPEAGPARVELFDVAGRRLAEPFDGILEAGDHVLRFPLGSGTQLPLAAGVYLVRVTAGALNSTMRVVVTN
jgi:hypothetical protein